MGHGRYLPRFAAALFKSPGPGIASIVIIVVTIPVNILVCIALLRHAQLLRGEQRSAIRELESVFA